MQFLDLAKAAEVENFVHGINRADQKIIQQSVEGFLNAYLKKHLQALRLSFNAVVNMHILTAFEIGKKPEDVATWVQQNKPVHPYFIEACRQKIEKTKKSCLGLCS